MISFGQYLLLREDSYDAATITRLSTIDLGTVYTWLKWGNAAKTGFTDENPGWKKRRDNIGAELGKRARGGEVNAKKALNNRLFKGVNKMGKTFQKPKKLDHREKLARHHQQQQQQPAEKSSIIQKILKSIKK